MHLEVDVTLVESPLARPYRKFLPADSAVQYLDSAGALTESEARYPRPGDDRLVEMHRNMVLGRRFDQQATALTKQGRLAVYPSSRGQEACQIAAAMSLRPTDWMFPTYRDSVALAARGIDPVEILSMLAGDWHCGYDPARHRSAPQCTPLATQLLHATGVAYGEHRRGRNTIALAFCGDGATSEGDFHEALNFAAVFQAPVVFLVQNNGFAISVPLARQSAAPTLAHKGVGYGIGSEQVDGNDAVAMLAVMDEAANFVRAGNGPVIVEAHTYRIDAHTNADDATRYRDSSEVEQWLGRDPLTRLEKYLRGQNLLDDAAVDALTAEADTAAAALRAGMNVDRPRDPLDLFRHVFAEPTPQLREQQAQVQAELAAESEEH
ncbi:pyruvate dehydrogenase (acetyl-transferring) E1 component subunit alpha [Rhodococcus sp. T2V]|uniref:pyruvate dehydrogenase (acetyl-transferring) E1 component subunit alpha n=1 Tax=Rhodococcus sp. T2V TaxID=3034164 RepID=UPI0023E27802|nr:pyruvate dehydrogenase (acetyl-transferring) E1 component subunit alpha [Rhodococcus sp. T2V]MDF3308009.1 pyruvate dehydrogenase (acetyl-transferring) E1 component subunit alpha [Rhodococcus sp. T2V]